MSNISGFLELDAVDEGDAVWMGLNEGHLAEGEPAAIFLLKMTGSTLFRIGDDGARRVFSGRDGVPAEVWIVFHAWLSGLYDAGNGRVSRAPEILAL
tara:strand:- start:131 stop:421 length:291 start_codon:yes stop_codon:yes gene_type:complete